MKKTFLEISKNKIKKKLQRAKKTECLRGKISFGRDNERIIYNIS